MVHVESTLQTTQGTLSQNGRCVSFSGEIQPMYEVLFGVCGAGDFSEVRIFAVFDAGMIVAAETVTEP